MRSRLFACALGLLAAGIEAQVTLIAPGSDQGKAGRPSEANYGPARPIDIDALFMMPETYQRSHVIVEGEISEVADHWTVRGGGAVVLLIPARGFDPGDFDQAEGKSRVEVRGVVRVLRDKQYVGPTRTDLDLIEDPILPPLPAPRLDLPRVSITVFALRDRTTPGEFKSKETSGGMGRQILDEPSAYSGKTTKILGQFRGRNLFGDLPAGSARGKDDWVLKDGDTAVWVMGKAPKGDGWKLDLDYKGDSKNWLEVEGKPEVVNGVVYFKASKVVPRKAPGSEKSGAPPR